MALLLPAVQPLAVNATAGVADGVDRAQKAFNDRHPQLIFEEHLAYQNHFRAQFDFLDASDKSILEVVERPDPNDSWIRYGLELTDEEFAEMERRQRIQSTFPSIVEAVVGTPLEEEWVEGLTSSKDELGALAGRWIDQLDGGKLKVALVENHPDKDEASERLWAAVHDAVRLGQIQTSDVELVPAEFSLDQLIEANEDFSTQYLGGTVVLPDQVAMSASIDEVNNRIRLEAEAEFVETAKKFASRYPDELVAVVEVPSGSLDIDPQLRPMDNWGTGKWHAGSSIRIWREYSSGTDYSYQTCTWGATVRTTSFVYAVTAAHCLGYTSTGTGYTSWYNGSVGYSSKRGMRANAGGAWISDLNDNTFVAVYHGSRGDIARLQINEFQNTTSGSCYLNAYSWCGKNMSGRESTTQTLIGELKCASLGSSNVWRCGNLNSNDASVSGYDYLRQVDLSCAAGTVTGDSGSGWKESSGSLYTGIHLGSKPLTCDAVLTHAYYVVSSSHLRANVFCGSSGVCNN